MSRYPPAEAILSEMAAINPIVFLHSLMVSEAYRQIRSDYVKRITASTSLNQPAKEKIERYLASFDIPIFFHDFGKWLLDRNIEESVRIINTPPPPYTNSNSRYNFDTRSPREIAYHKIHTLTGGFGLIELADILNDFPIDTKMVREFLFGFHEKLNGQTSRPSYPRSKSRIENPYDRLVLFLAQLSDIAVAMGQPRSFRDYRLDNGSIFQSLSELIEKSLPNEIFSANHEKEKLRIEGALIDMTFSALRSIQDKYPAPTCYKPPPFTIFGRSLSKNTDYLSDTAVLTWNKHEPRLMEAYEKFYL